MADKRYSEKDLFKFFMGEIKKVQADKEYYKGQPLRLYRLDFKENTSDDIIVEMAEAYSHDDVVGELIDSYKDISGNVGQRQLAEIVKVAEITNIDDYLDCMLIIQKEYISRGNSKEKTQQEFAVLHKHIVDDYFPIWESKKKEATESVSKGVCPTDEDDNFEALDSNEVFGEFDIPVELEAQFEEEDQRYKKATRDRIKAYRVEYRVNTGWDSFVDIVESTNTENILQKIQSYFENRKESVTVVNLTEIESIHECVKYAHDMYISLLQRKYPVCKAKEIITELLEHLLNRYLIRWVKYDRW